MVEERRSCATRSLRSAPLKKCRTVFFAGRVPQSTKAPARASKELIEWQRFSIMMRKGEAVLNTVETLKDRFEVVVLAENGLELCTRVLVHGWELRVDVPKVERSVARVQ